MSVTVFGLDPSSKHHENHKPIMHSSGILKINNDIFTSRGSLRLYPQHYDTPAQSILYGYNKACTAFANDSLLCEKIFHYSLINDLMWWKVWKNKVCTKNKYLKCEWHNNTQVPWSILESISQLYKQNTWLKYLTELQRLVWKNMLQQCSQQPISETDSGERCLREILERDAWERDAWERCLRDTFFIK